MIRRLMMIAASGAALNLPFEAQACSVVPSNSPPKKPDLVVAGRFSFLEYDERQVGESYITEGFAVIRDIKVPDRATPHPDIHVHFYEEVIANECFIGYAPRERSYSMIALEKGEFGSASYRVISAEDRQSEPR